MGIALLLVVWLGLQLWLWRGQTRICLARGAEALWLGGWLAAGGLAGWGADWSHLLLVWAGAEILRWLAAPSVFWLRWLGRSAVMLVQLVLVLNDIWGWAFGLWLAAEMVSRWLLPVNGAVPPVLADLLARLARCDLPDVILLLSDQKARGKANAGFAGPPWARKIVLSPALLVALSPEQVVAVVAHEVGHCRLGHEERWLAGQAALALALFAALDAVQDSGAQILVLTLWLLAPVAGFFLRPLAAALRRRWETQADGFAARYVGAEVMAAALESLERTNGPAPRRDRLWRLFYGYHPTLEQRLALLGDDDHPPLLRTSPRLGL